MSRLSRTLRRLVVLAAVSTAGIALALGLGAPDPGIAERAYGAAMGLLGCLAGIAYVAERERPGTGPGEDGDEDSAANDPALRALSDLERNLRLGRLTLGDFHVLVRPRLVDLVASRLARRGVPLASPAARSALGDSYALVDPSSSTPTDRSRPGVPLAAVADLVARLEELS